MPRPAFRLYRHAVAVRRDRRGAADLLDRARIRQPARRGAGGADDGGLVLLGVEARLAKTDAVLLFTVVAAMGAMARVYLDRLDGWSGWQRQLLLPLIFWSALALGVLVKGPLILMIVGLPALTLCIVDRSARWLAGLRPLIGVPMFLVLVLPWFVAIYARSGTTFFRAIGRRRSAGQGFVRARNRTARRRAIISCCSC